MVWFINYNKNNIKDVNLPSKEISRKFSLQKDRKKSWIVYSFICFLIIFNIICLSSLVFKQTSTWLIFQLKSRYTDDIILEPRISFLNTTSDYYLSFTIDAWQLREMNNLPISNKKLINLARHLSPAYVRYGGTSADCLFFNETLNESKKMISPVNGEDISKFSISEKDFQSLYEFSKNSNLKMIFDLNALIRKQDGSWDDTNAKKIIQFARKWKMNIDWQLGNEPPNFPLLFNVTIPAEQLARDYCHLRSLLNSLGYKKNILVGPEVNQVGGPSFNGENYTRIFLENSKESTNYVTWHQYYLRGEDAHFNDFINASTFNYLPYLIKSMQTAIDKSGNKIPMWLSETSTAFDRGAPGISDRFIAGFLWLDKLGYSAKAGIKVIIRQTLIGGNYGMISSDLTPNPDWWISVIYKNFVSNQILQISTKNNFGNTRLYCHCTPEKIFPNSITIFGVNINEKSIRLSLENISIFSKSKISLYILTADNLLSRSIKMNGKVLNLLKNGDLPSFTPISHENEKIITLPAYSMIFIIIQNVSIPIC
ncbi:heparanase-like [Leptopilina boulardi]|uniref:heparanase-like n=1 Tax=Leptopilina boulardi TaxID=63433 RepID=UPI0021F680AD|nr:heparanase-like [Leptopilina boulardi]